MEKLLRDASGSHDPEDGWRFLKEKNGVKSAHFFLFFFFALRVLSAGTVSRKKSVKVKGQRCIDSFRGVGSFKVDARAFKDLVTDLHDGRKKIDAMFKHGRIVKQVDPYTAIVHYEMQAEKCIIDVHRDLLFLQHARELGDGVWVIASRSDGADQNLVPSPAGAQRALVMNSGFVLRPRAGGMCDICYVVQVELGNIPESVLNLVAQQQPLLIARAAQCLQSGHVSPRKDSAPAAGTRTRRDTEESFSDLVSARSEQDDDADDLLQTQQMDRPAASSPRREQPLSLGRNRQKGARSPIPTKEGEEEQPRAASPRTKGSSPPPSLGGSRHRVVNAPIDIDEDLDDYGKDAPQGRPSPRGEQAGRSRRGATAPPAASQA